MTLANSLKADQINDFGPKQSIITAISQDIDFYFNVSHELMSSTKCGSPIELFLIQTFMAVNELGLLRPYHAVENVMFVADYRPEDIAGMCKDYNTLIIDQQVWIDKRVAS